LSAGSEFSEGYVAADPLPISALQHLIFCERQCALIHIEGLWAENRLTIEGRILHRRAHAEDAGPRGGGRAESRRRGSPGGDQRVRIVRGLALQSERLGLVGKADIVEFRLPGGAALRAATPPAPAQGTPLVPHALLGTPFPIEYKRGRPKRHDADLVQLCAQAMCLEEMLGLAAGGVPAGALYYGRTRHQLDVPFDRALRERTEAACARLHELIAFGVTPRARREKKCDRCSLLHLCLPDATAPGKSAARYVERALAAASQS
jgi:CRISPR-associated exonuclease Cas4